MELTAFEQKVCKSPVIGFNRTLETYSFIFLLCFAKEQIAERKVKFIPTRKELFNLQELIVKAILLGQSLPGCTQAIRFPDLSFILNQPIIFLVDENLFGYIAIEESPRPIRILSVEDLRQECQNRGDIAYLQFQPSEVRDDEVQVTLVARIATSDPNKQTLGLSDIHVKFVKVADEWKVMEEPVFSAV